MFPLLKLPLLALKEVFKSMVIKELFCASFASKKTKRLIKSSIPRDSLWFEFRIGHVLDVRCEDGFLLVNLMDIPGIISHHVEFPQRKNMINHFVETFNNPEVSLECFNAEESFILEVIHHFKTCHLDIQEIKIRQDVSRETVTQILNDCTDVHKLQFFSFRGTFQLEPDVLNTFFKKLVSTDCKLNVFHIDYNASQDFPRVFGGLTDSPIQAGNVVMVQTTDETKLKIKWDESFIEMKRVKDA